MLGAKATLTPRNLSHRQQRVKEFHDEGLTVSGSRLFCTVWWSQQTSELPTLASAFLHILLIQPSSAAAEEVFSLLTNSFGANQDLALQDYIESSLMFQYNGR